MSLIRAAIKGIILVFCLVFSSTVVYGQGSYPPKNDPYINDLAKIIKPEDAEQTRELLINLKNTADIDMVVLTINSIHDYQTGDSTIETFATNLFNTWGIGNAATNKGVLILVAVMNREVGVLNDALESSDERQCAAGDLPADALLDRMEGAQIALVLGHWENGLEAGTLTQGMLFSANRSTANPGKAELTGEQILQFLRAALKPENAARTLRQLRGRAIGMPHIAGASVRYTENLEELNVEINGKPLENNQKYSVASTDMGFADFLDYLVIPFEQMEFEVPTIMPEVLEEYIARHSPISKPKDGRIILKTN